MRILHAADLHLDSPMRGLERYQGAPAAAMRDATRRALANLIDLCIDEAVDLLLIAGDLYDDDWRDYSTGLFFVAEIQRLKEVSTRVVIVRGNHDAASHITRYLRLPEHVHVLSSSAPESLAFENHGVVVHGQSFPHRAVTEDLASRYPDARSGLVNIGMLHTSLDGRPGHDAYAPTTLGVLRSKGYDYWALGHVHAREEVSNDPWVVFPGNLQGRHARETGPKGATLIEVENGRIVSVVPKVLDVARWAAVRVMLQPDDTFDDALGRAKDALEHERALAEDRIVAARVTLEGASRAHATIVSDPERARSELRACGAEVGGLWVERILIDTRAPVDLEALSRRDDALGSLIRSVQALSLADDAALLDLGSSLADLEAKLPAKLRTGADGLDFKDPATLRRLVARVRETLLPALLGESD